MGTLPGPRVTTRTGRGLSLVLSIVLAFFFSAPGLFAQQRDVQQLSPERLKKIQMQKLEEQYYPALKFRVLDLEGKPRVLPENAERWRALQEDELLSEGARIVTLQGDSVQLKIPGISLVELNKNTEVILRKLAREIRFGKKSEVFEFGTQPDATHAVELETLEGEVHNSISDRIKKEDQKLDYKIRTPQSVAGVRGTTFNCSVSEQETECSVLEGKIHLASLKQPGAGKIITDGQKSRVRSNDTAPDAPTEISIDKYQPMKNLMRSARTKLRLEPFVGNFVFAGKEPRKVAPNDYRMEVNYDQPRRLKLLGEAQAREPGASIETVSVRHNGQNLPVENPSQWSVSVKPDTLFPGQRRTLRFRIVTRDNKGVRSLSKTLTVDLVNRDVSNPFPQDYSPGEVDVEITSIGRQKLKNFDYPFHLFLDDLEQGQNALQVVGEAGGYEPVQSVAYSLDRGVTWDLAEGTFSWEFHLPVNPGVKQELRPRLRAWTREGTIGEAKEFGPFVFHPKTYSQHLGDQLRRFWQAFVNRDLEGVKRSLADRMRLEDNKSTLVVYRDRFLQSLKELFAVSRDMSVTTRIREASAGRNRADMTYSLEVNGRELNSDKHFKILSPYVYMAMKRGNDGRFLVRRIEDLLTKRFMHTKGFETVPYGQGYDLRELTVKPRKKGLIFFNRYGDQPGDWTLKLGEGIFKGGLINLGASSLAQAYPLPDLDSTQYSSWVYAEPGNLYALNARTENGRLTSFFRFKNVTKDSLDVQVYTIRKLPGF